MHALHLSALTLLALLVGVFIFITARHATIVRRRRPSPPQRGTGTPFFAGHDSYIFIVLGSGGHTKEMLFMLESGFGAFRNMRRRYVVSSGDSTSPQHMKQFENDMADRYGAENVGVYDVHVVRRARRIHQPLLTVPFSGLLSFLEIFPLLARPWAAKVPDLILTNGPATGFFVGLAAHVLKVFMLVPDASMQVVYVESWARKHTLSLSGKLFYHTRIADLFLVQHQPVADKYGVTNAGWLVTVGPN